MEYFAVVHTSDSIDRRWFIGSLVHWFIGSLVHWFIGSLVHWLVQYSARKGDTVVPQSASSAVCLICNQQRDSQIEPDFALECGHAYVAHHESNGSLEQLTNTMMQLAAFTSHAFAVG
jgi:hypothetical protein